MCSRRPPTRMRGMRKRRALRYSAGRVMPSAATPSEAAASRACWQCVTRETGEGEPTQLMMRPRPTSAAAPGSDGSSRRREVIGGSGRPRRDRCRRAAGGRVLPPPYWDCGFPRVGTAHGACTVPARNAVHPCDSGPTSPRP